MRMANQYIYILNPCRPSFPGDATPEELAKVGEHFSYLQELLAQGKLILAGRTQDDQPEGYVIFEAQGDEEAVSIMESDPAVLAGIFIPRLRPYRVALCREGLR